MTEKQLREKSKTLDKLCVGIVNWLGELDKECKRLNEPGCGPRLAKLANALEMANDSAMHFACGWSFKKIGNLKKARRA